MRILNLILSAAIGLLIVQVRFVPQALAQPSQPIRIGVLDEITGPVATSGLALLIGVKLAVTEINASGGILGRQVEIVVADNQSDPTKSVGEAQRLASVEKVDAIIGPNTSPSNLAVAPIFTAAKLFQISQAGSLQMTPQRVPYQFGVLNNANAQAQVMVEYAGNVLKAKSVAILTDDTAQSKDGTEAIKKELAARGVSLAGSQEFRFNVGDVTPQLLILRRSGADTLLIFTSTAADTATLKNGITDIGWDVQVVASNAVWLLASAIAAAGGPDVFRNVAGTAMTAFTYCADIPPLGEAPFAKLYQKLKLFAPNDYNKASPEQMTWFYDAVYLIKQAAEGVGKLDGPAMTDWVIENAAKVKAVSGQIAPTTDSHFLWGRNTMTIVQEPNQKRSDGLVKRGGC